MTHNIAASVHQRLLNQARAQGRPFDELLQYLAVVPYQLRCSLAGPSFARRVRKATAALSSPRRASRYVSATSSPKLMTGL